MKKIIRVFFLLSIVSFSHSLIAADTSELGVLRRCFNWVMGSRSQDNSTILPLYREVEGNQDSTVAVGSIPHRHMTDRLILEDGEADQEERDRLQRLADERWSRLSLRQKITVALRCLGQEISSNKVLFGILAAVLLYEYSGKVVDFYLFKKFVSLFVSPDCAT